MTMTDSEWVDRGRRREQVLLSVMNMPRMPHECRRILGYKNGNKFAQTFKEFRDKNLMRSIFGGLHGLTERGQRLKKRMSEEKGIPYIYNEPRLDWKSYVWIKQGAQRAALLKAVQRHPMFVARLVRLGRQIHAALSRTDAYGILRQFNHRGLANEFRERKHVLYAITRKGNAIKRQLLMLWFATFVFYVG